MNIVIAIGLWFAVSALVCFGMGKFIRAGARDSNGKED